MRCFTFWSVCLLVLAACSDDNSSATGDGGSSSPTCLPAFGSAQACGGTLSGTYRYLSACTTTAALADIQTICTSATVNNVVSIPSGSLSFSGGNYALNVTTTISGKATFPKSCLVTKLGCAPIATAYNNLVKSGTAACTDKGTACECEVSYPLRVNSNGKLTTGNGIAKLGLGIQYYYCVSGNVLRYKGVPGRVADDKVSYVLTR